MNAYPSTIPAEVTPALICEAESEDQTCGIIACEVNGQIAIMINDLGTCTGVLLDRAGVEALALRLATLMQRTNSCEALWAGSTLQ